MAALTAVLFDCLSYSYFKFGSSDCSHGIVVYRVSRKRFLVPRPGRKTFLAIRSHGYEYPEETFLGQGVNVTIEPGKMREVRIRRTMIAERLYRLTGTHVLQSGGRPRDLHRRNLYRRV